VKQILGYALAIVAIAYVGFVGLMYAAMNRTPGEFSRFMMRVPRPLMMATPFPPMWAKARGGALQVGDAAPDFDLARQDHRERVKLSDFRGKKPVVLIFGSYT